MSIDPVTLKSVEPNPVASHGAPIVYLVRREGLSSVFASQVLSRMARVGELGFSVEIGVFTPAGQWFRQTSQRRWKELVRDAPAVLQGRVRRLPSFPSRIDWPAAEARMLACWLRLRFRHSARAPVIAHCRNATVTGMALALRRALPDLRVVFDCRGVSDHERLYIEGFTYETAPEALRREVTNLDEEQRRAALEADAVFCVSESMVDYLVSRYGVDRDKCLVVPCCVDGPRFGVGARRRQEMRSQLGLAERFVVAYCGSVERYQLPRESVALFQRIGTIEPRAHFLAVTTNTRAMRAAILEAGVDETRVTVVSVRHAEVPAHLAAADVGLLLREESVVNRVASPVKFAEYLASGTPVIVTGGVGDYSDLTARERVGVVLAGPVGRLEHEAPLRSFVTDYRADTEEWRRRCRETAARHLEFDRYLPLMAAVYRQLGTPSPEDPICAAC
jgi:glycosyltransferase involved in cell wall biosynthesis